jgi:hypothetical protein
MFNAGCIFFKDKEKKKEEKKNEATRNVFFYGTE